MWFLGVVAGLFFGGLLGGPIGAIIGAIVGGVAFARLFSKERAGQEAVGEAPAEYASAPAHRGAPEPLEARIARLEGEVSELRAQIAGLRGTGAVTEAGAPTSSEGAPPAPEPAVPSHVWWQRPEPPQTSEADAAPPSGPEPASESVPAAESTPTPTPAGGVPDFEPAPAAALAAEEPPAGFTMPAWVGKLFSGNIVAKLGVVVLFFGVGFLLKFAYDRDLIPVPLRLAGVAFAGAGMVWGGWRLLSRRRLYGLILQGGGVGLMYLDVFFALKTFALIGTGPAFALFMALGVTTALLAVRQDARPLAVLGLFGAFLAPVLASRGGGSHVVLFSYYTLLNLFILAISWWRAWRDLNLVGFLFTFFVAVFWWRDHYQASLFASVEPFVLIFFAIYLVIPILFATRQPPELRGLVDGTLVFGTPLSVAFMQATLVKDLPDGLALSAAVGAALYAVLALMVWRRENMRLLGETYAALAVGLLTLAIFFAFDAYPTFALWTIEGAAVSWVGFRQRRLLPRLFGTALQIVGALYFLWHYGDYDLRNPWFNDFFVGSVFVAAAGLLSAWLRHRYREVVAASISIAPHGMLAWGALWWFVAGLHALHLALPPTEFHAALALFAAASFVVAEWVGAKLAWPGLRLVPVAHVIVLYLAAALTAADARHPLADFGLLTWPLAFAAYFWALHRHERDDLPALRQLRYVLGWIGLALLATWEGSWRLEHREYWFSLLWGGLGAFVAWLRFALRERARSEAAPLSLLVLVWSAIWWAGGGAGLISIHVAPEYDRASLLVFASLSLIAGELLGRRLAWPAPRQLSFGHLPALLLFAIAALQVPDQHPLGAGGWAAWPLSFAVFFWTLARQRRDGIEALAEPRVFAAWLLIGALATWEELWLLWHRHYEEGLAWAGVALAASYLRHRLREKGRAATLPVSVFVMIWGLAFWLASGLGFVHEHAAAAARVTLALAWVAGSAVLFELAGAQLDWQAIRRTQGLILPAMLIAAAMLFADGYHPSQGYGWIVWPAAYAGFYLTLRRQEPTSLAYFVPLQHVASLWLLTGLAAWEAHAAVEDLGWARMWSLGAVALVPAMAILAVTRLGRAGAWPVGPRLPLYRDVALAPIAIYAALWLLYANVVDPGPSRPLAYFPLLNGIDIGSLAALAALLVWQRARDSGAGRVAIPRLLALLGFLWINGAVLRSIHFWLGVPYQFDALVGNVVVQASFSLLWSVTALGLMAAARRRMERPLWIAGAFLLAVVVAKLFLVDLANTGTVARIVSFLGVGVLLLVIGYVAPVPPGAAERTRD